MTGFGIGRRRAGSRIQKAAERALANARTAAELARLMPARIVILGGSGVVGDIVVGLLSPYTSEGVYRYSGPDRYATAAAISANVFSPGVPVAYVATGLNFPDALAGAAAAGALGAPPLLVTVTPVTEPPTVRLMMGVPARAGRLASTMAAKIAADIVFIMFLSGLQLV